METPWLFNRLHGMLRPGMHMKAHMHNTFGLAVANTLASVEGGADSVDGIRRGDNDD